MKLDYLKQDIYATERAKMRFVTEWDKVCKELREKFRKGAKKEVKR